MGGRVRSVVVIGGGPSGAALSYYLARAGREVVLFAPGKRPPLLIGESLVPAIVPFLRELGIEEEVRGYSIFKPGATFTLTEGDRVSLTFDEIRGSLTNYSYNSPRDRLDASILGAAQRAGVHVIEQGAKLERDEQPDRVRLSVDSLAATGGVLRAQPDLIVDATGRSRVLPRLLGVGERRGDRRDTALFSHMRGVPLFKEGDVHTDILERGWSWRIPLPGRVSVGLVIPGDHGRGTD